MCEAFQVEELAVMIRATRGRSMDGWMDGQIAQLSELMDRFNIRNVGLEM